MRHRRWNHFLARAGGFAWTPCPLCGQTFSGYEWRHWDYATIPTGEPGKGQGICGDCAAKGLARR